MTNQTTAHAPKPAAPQAPRPPANPTVFSRGKFIVAQHGAQFPDRCIRCNARASLPRLRRKLVWLEPSKLERARLLMWISLLFRILYQWKHRRKTTVEVALCRSHKILRHLAPLIPVAGATGAWLIIHYGFDRNTYNPLPLFGAFSLFIASLLLTLWARRTVRVRHMDTTCVTLAGAGPAFVKSLPMDSRPAAAAASAAALSAAVRGRTPPRPPASARA